MTKDSLETEELEDDVFVSPGQPGNYSYISDASESDSAENPNLEEKNQNYFSHIQTPYLQLPEVVGKLLLQLYNLIYAPSHLIDYVSKYGVCSIVYIL